MAGGGVAGGLGRVASGARGGCLEGGADQQAEREPEHIILGMWIVAVLALFAQAPADPLPHIEKLIAAGRYQEALAGLAGRPESFERHMLASKAYDGMGDAGHAVSEAEAALAMRPRAEAAHLQLGQIFLSYNTPQAALDVFTEALTYHPDSFLLHAGRGLALKDLVLYEEAEKELSACLKGRPGFPICFDGLATVLLHGKRYGELQRAAEAQEKLNPGDYRGPYFLAVALNAAGGDAGVVEKKLEAALGKNSGFAAAHALLGRVRLARGAVGEAIASLEQAVRLRADYPPALLNLAQAYKRAGRDADAEKTFELLRRANEKEREGKPSLKYHRGAAAPKN